MERREYSTYLNINGREIIKIIIDSHYELRHKESINDEVVLKLVKMLDGSEYLPVDIDENGFEYFVNDNMSLDGKNYKLIWLLHANEIFIGIVNAYRRD